MKQLKLNVTGMHCHSCETLIKDALEKIDGIKEVQVSHKTGNIIVDYDEKKVSEAKIRELIRKEGYKA
jgi:copper chaperone CopZ